MNLLISKQISNHPNLSEVKRFVNVYGVNVRSDLQRLVIDYNITYFKEDKDITNQFNPNPPSWIVTNSYKVKVLDENGEYIPNPDYVPEYEDDKIINSDDEYIREWAFDYFMQITFESETPVSIKDLLETYITIDDLTVQRFNF